MILIMSHAIVENYVTSRGINAGFGKIDYIDKLGHFSKGYEVEKDETFSCRQHLLGIDQNAIQS
ncbi:hypothetical protein J6590_019284 [Homalodisca vitripennis]|nr:hypothetical protein J6590_019284 [Homalodisca vitripennis]